MRNEVPGFWSGPLKMNIVLYQKLPGESIVKWKRAQGTLKEIIED